MDSWMADKRAYTPNEHLHASSSTAIDLGTGRTAVRGVG